MSVFFYVQNHKEAHAQYYRHDEQWQNYLAGKGAEEQAKENASLDYSDGDFVPYLQMHSNLSNIEREAGIALQTFQKCPSLLSLTKAR